MRLNVPCLECGGLGEIEVGWALEDGGEIYKCPECDGSGVVPLDPEYEEGEAA